MPKRCNPKFVSQYLIPSLDTQRFGKHLKWIDKQKGIFELDWCHKGGPSWTEEEAEVFVEWDKIKGHYQPEDKQYYTKSKQRFRALLYKLTIEGQIKKLKCEDKYKKVYSIGEKKLSKRRKNRKDSNIENDFGRNVTDGISDDDKDECIDGMSWREVSYDNFRANDHNYSSSPSNSSYTHSDSEDQISTPQGNSAIPISLYGLYENPEEKVLVQLNYPYSACVNICVPVTKDTYLKDSLEDMHLDEDFRNLPLTKNDGQTFCDSRYDLPLFAKIMYDNKLPAEILESNSATDSKSFNSEHFLFDLSIDDLHPLY